MSLAAAGLGRGSVSADVVFHSELAEPKFTVSMRLRLWLHDSAELNTMLVESPSQPNPSGVGLEVGTTICGAAPSASMRHRLKAFQLSWGHVSRMGASAWCFIPVQRRSWKEWGQSPSLRI